MTASTGKRRPARRTPGREDGMTQAEVAEALGISSARVGQIEHAALKKLRAAIEADDLAPTTVQQRITKKLTGA